MLELDFACLLVLQCDRGDALSFNPSCPAVENVLAPDLGVGETGAFSPPHKVCRRAVLVTDDVLGLLQNT